MPAPPADARGRPPTPAAHVASRPGNARAPGACVQRHSAGQPAVAPCAGAGAAASPARAAQPVGSSPAARLCLCCGCRCGRAAPAGAAPRQPAAGVAARGASAGGVVRWHAARPCNGRLGGAAPPLARYILWQGPGGGSSGARGGHAARRRLRQRSAQRRAAGAGGAGCLRLLPCAGGSRSCARPPGPPCLAHPASRLALASAAQPGARMGLASAGQVREQAGSGRLP